MAQALDKMAAPMKHLLSWVSVTDCLCFGFPVKIVFFTDLSIGTKIAFAELIFTLHYHNAFVWISCKSRTVKITMSLNTFT